MTAQSPKSTSIDNIEELDGLLSGLDTSVTQSDEQIEEIIETAEAALGSGIEDLDLSDDELRSVEASFVREEAYNEQESTVDTAAAAPKGKKQKTEKAAKEKKEDGTPAVRVVRDLNSLSPAIFNLEGDVPTDPAELEAMKKETMALSPSQKKIAEKFENLFVSIANDRLPSTFIVQAFMILDREGSLSSADLVAAYKTKGAKSPSEGYNEGTSRSQAGQIMHLFEVVKIATRAKQNLTLNKKSTVALKLRQLIENSSKTSA